MISRDLTCLAGLPKYTEYELRFEVAIPPTDKTECEKQVTPGQTTLFAPIQTPLSKTIGFAIKSKLDFL